MEAGLNNEIICLENAASDTRWLRTVDQDDHLYVIETSSYAKIKTGYAMEFQDQGEFQSWLDNQSNSGWSMVFRDRESPDLVDPATLRQLQDKVFSVLNSK
jgi:hypothetical protein